MKKLGFGFMRLPMTDKDDPKSIDKEMLKKMVDIFLERGFTYFDTAYMYHDHASEAALREVLTERHPRGAFTVATKLPLMFLEKEGDQERIFDEQLEKCGVGYFDYYLLHNVNVHTYEKMKEFDSFGFIAKMKERGLIKHIGFSYHDDAELLDRVLTEHPEAEFVQLQLNYLDWDNESIQSRRCYETARRHGKPVVVMEPVKGGLLAKLPADVSARLAAVTPGQSDASWAMRFVGSLPNVKVILSGMSDASQVMDNISTFRDFKPLSEAERAALDTAVETLKARVKNPCTGCGYCMPCPAGVDIPRNFRVWNMFGVYQNAASAAAGWKNIPEGARADACVACGACLEKCPQRIGIPDDLRRVREDAHTWQ